MRSCSRPPGNIDTACSSPPLMKTQSVSPYVRFGSVRRKYEVAYVVMLPQQ